jgi:hypothetical protein
MQATGTNTASGKQLQQIPYCPVAFQRVFQRIIFKYLVTVAATALADRQEPGRLQVRNNALHCALRNTYPKGDIPQSHGRVASQTNQHVTVVTQDSPTNLVFLKIIARMGLTQHKA